jgi:elongation of very long chain fatty acids protein 7
LIRSPFPGLTIIALYLYFVNVAGPRFMKDRKPFTMKKTLIVYNFLQVLVSVYLFVEVSRVVERK